MRKLLFSFLLATAAVFAQYKSEPAGAPPADVAPDIGKALDDARAAGCELIDPEPRLGMHGSLIAFVHPKSLNGVLTEFVET